MTAGTTLVPQGGIGALRLARLWIRFRLRFRLERMVGLSLLTLQVTHKIDKDTDIERDHIVNTLLEANPEAKLTVIRNFSTDHSYEVYTGKRTLAYNSTNALVRNPSWEIGLQKTGFINEAGECLVMQATIHDRPMIMVLLDSSGKYSRFADAQRLRTWLDNGGEQRITSADANGAGT